MLRLTNIDAHYDKTQVLKGMSLVVEDRRIVTLIGANGAGKTTTLKTITGMVRPTSGQIEFNGERIDRLSTTEIVRRGISRVPQGRQVFQRMTVMENLKLGAYLVQDRKRVDDRLDLVLGFFPALKERLGVNAGTLSGGQQQMVALGRGLMADPKLLLLDEPSLGLAPQIIMDVARTILQIFKMGVDIVLVEQNARMALNLCHHAYVIETGSVTMEGRGKDLAGDPSVIDAYLGGH